MSPHRPTDRRWRPPRLPRRSLSGAAGASDRKCRPERGGLAGLLGRRKARVRGVDVDDGRRHRGGGARRGSICPCTGICRFGSDGQRRCAVARCCCAWSGEAYRRTGRGGGRGSARDIGTRTGPAIPVCAVLSGGNIDPLVLTCVITHGLRGVFSRSEARHSGSPRRAEQAARRGQAKAGPACSTWCTPAQHPSWHWTKFR